ncbi:hypothetical protein GN956_G19893 [Arapaima gigas]
MASNQQQPPPASAEGKNPKTSKKPLTVSTKEPLYLLIDTHHKDQVLVCSPAQRSRRPEGPQSTKVAQRKTLHPLELPVAEHKDSPVPRGRPSLTWDLGTCTGAAQTTVDAKVLNAELFLQGAEGVRVR